VYPRIAGGAAGHRRRKSHSENPRAGAALGQAKEPAATRGSSRMLILEPYLPIGPYVPSGRDASHVTGAEAFRPGQCRPGAEQVCRLLPGAGWTKYGCGIRPPGAAIDSSAHPRYTICVTSEYACWGSPGSRAERMATPPSTPEPDLDNASVGKHLHAVSAAEPMRVQAAFLFPEPRDPAPQGKR